MINKTFLLTTLSLSFIVKIIEKHIFNDWQFVIALAVVVCVDTLLGLILHFKNQTISSTGFAQLFIKFIIYGSVLILSHVLTSFKVNGTNNILFDWVDDALYSALMLREAISIIEKIGLIKPELLPKWILKRLKEFDSEGNIQNLN